jgi:hypothetical protein
MSKTSASISHSYHFTLDVQQQNKAQIDNVQDTEENLQMQ